MTVLRNDHFTVFLLKRNPNPQNRTWFSILFELISGQVVPSWNATISYKTSSSLTVRWSSFPLGVQIQRFLVIYKEQNSSVSLIYQVGNWYNSHNSGSILRGYQFYQVNIIAVVTNSGNGTYSSEATIVRTNEGGKKKKKKWTLFFELSFWIHLERGGK